jgi:hypothetical protein
VSGNLRYRAFKQEMLSLAGYYTGEELVIIDEYMHEDAIAVHERVHRQIFAETLDGKLHKSVILCLRESIYSENRGLFIAVNDFLFDDTRLAHERAATFLGVVGLSTRTDILDARAMLNEEYSSYFTYFSDFLPWVDSSFLSFLIANSIARFAFCSERLSKISDLSTLTVENLQSVEGPEQRMDLVKQLFIEEECASPQFIESIFNLIFISQSIEPYDVFDDCAWETRINSGVTDTSVIDRIGCEVFEALFASLPGQKDNKKAPFPKWFEAIASSIPSRDFNADVSLIDGVRSLPENAAFFYAKEADKNAISRQKFIEIPESSLETSFNLILGCIERDLCVVFTQIKGQLEHFKMFSSIIHNGQSSFLPGSGLIVNINAIIELAVQLGDITVEHNLPSPLFYIIYTPGAPDERGTPMMIPRFEEENVKLFTNHLAIDGKPAAGQGLLIRPIVYARPFWTYAIDNTTGEHRDYSIRMINLDHENHSKDYWAQILVPINTPGFPTMAILDRISGSTYNDYVKFRVAQGYLTSKQELAIDRGLSESFSAVWQTLPLI